MGGTEVLRSVALDPANDLAWRLGEDEPKDGPLAYVISSSFYLHVVEVNLSGCEARERIAPALAGLCDVESITLSDAAFGDDEVAQIKHFPGLSYLGLGGTGVTDRGLAAVSGMTRLQALDLHGTNVSSAGMKFLTNMKALEQLSLDRTKIDDSAMEYLVQLQRLRYLDLSGTAVSDANIPLLSQIKSLDVFLGILGTKVSDDGNYKLFLALPKSCNIPDSQFVDAYRP